MLSLSSEMDRPGLTIRPAADTFVVRRPLSGLLVGPAVSLSLVTLAVGAIWRHAMVELAEIWQTDPNYSHGPLVALGALGLVALCRRQSGIPFFTSSIARREYAEALILLLAAFALHLTAWFVASLLLEVISLVFALWAVTGAAGGRRALYAYRFPLAFLIFAAPLPVAWHQAAATALQSVVAAATSGALHVLGIASFRTGNVIALANYSLEVGQACSGLRQLAGMVALAAALGAISGRGRAFVATLVVLAAPVAVLANCLRALMTALLAVTCGPQSVEGIYHSLEGLSVAALAGLLLAFIACLVARFDKRQSAEALAKTL